MAEGASSARRIALVAPEWVSTEEDPGPQALLTERLAVALLEAGWLPEVFAPADEAGTVDDDGITLHRVARGRAAPGAPLLARAERIVDRSILAHGLRRASNRKEILASTKMRERQAHLALVQQAQSLGEAVEARQRETPYLAAISTEDRLAGMFVPPRKSRPHIVRLASDPDSWASADEDTSQWRARLVADQHTTVQQAQAVYASSRAVAERVGGWFEGDVPVVRPPAPVDVHTGTRVAGTPRRYLAFCGPLDRRHGVETLAAALPFAWRTAPDLRVVMTGSAPEERLAEWTDAWRDDAEKVTVLDDLGGGDRIAVAARAVAVVVPGLVGDLDEVAQQALAVGVPVIATNATGTAELVEPGVTGRVVPVGSPQRLAEALADAWTGAWGLPSRVTWRGPVGDAMRPAAAAEALLALVAEQRERWRDATPHG